MTSSSTAASIASAMPKEVTGRHVLYAMLGFFGFIIATDAFLVYKAVSTFGGVETDDAYRKGLSYNDRISEERAQAALGWTNEAVLDGAKGELFVTIRDKDDQPVDNLQITAVMGRPATNVNDLTLKLTQIGRGRYMAIVGDIEPGTWVAALEAREALTGTGRVAYQSKVRLWKAP